MNKELDTELKEIFPEEKELEHLKNVPAAKAPAEIPAVDPEVIDITPVIIETDPAEPEKLAEEDFAYARKRIKKALDSSESVLDTAEQFANCSADPEVINSFSGLVRSVTEGSSKLLELHGKLKAIKKKDKDSEPSKTVTNNTLIVTTADMLRMIRKEINK